ncbi:hypothetical protein Pgy4_41634, partial [Pseudomonas savastanoi pv. glycinea str. race 4]
MKTTLDGTFVGLQRGNGIHQAHTFGIREKTYGLK